MDPTPPSEEGRREESGEVVPEIRPEPRAVPDDSGEEREAGESVGRSLPVLLESVEPIYPEELLADRPRAEVVLRLTIDVDGHVSEVEVVESAGELFDASALLAATRLRFAPATLQGETVRARILYKMTFEPPVEEPLSPPPIIAPGSEPEMLPDRVTASPSEPVEVTVRGEQNEAERLRNSAEAVTVIETREAKKETADLGEVLARTQGLGVRRLGGLGSSANISLNGLQGDQIRYFVDGVPLDRAGFPFGIVNMPVNFADRIEIYRGVVPIRFGADALGGAINVVTDQDYHPHLGASYQIGSFGLHRFTTNGRYRHYPSGIVIGGAAFIDIAKNDFIMSDRLIAQPDGSSVVRSVPRFHDAYAAYGGLIDIGVVDKPWARKLILQAFIANFDKDLQHNSLMTIPYGEVTYGQTNYGATARYEVEVLPNLELQLLANYAFRELEFRDMATNVYRWDGTQGRLIGREIAPGEPARGEIDARAQHQSIYENSVYSRAGLTWTIAPEHLVRVAVTPEYVTRIGDDHVPNRVDLLELESRMQKVVSGAEYELNLFDERLQNIAFGKLYYMAMYHEGRSERTAARDIFTLERDMSYIGGGDALRYRFTDWLLVKASYEYAIRLPRADELFGDGALVTSAASLKSERSHNINLGPRAEIHETPIGAVTLDSNGFVRDVEDMIVLLGGQQFVSYTNIPRVTAVGVENTLSWEAPQRLLGLDGMLTVQDQRNFSTSGPYEAMFGMQVPNRPYLFGSWGARSLFRGVVTKRDTLEPFYRGRYVHSFDRVWKLGDPDLRPVVDAQISHALGVTYGMRGEFWNVACTFEVDNLTDERLYDYYGVQRPGRSYALKLIGDLN